MQLVAFYTDEDEEQPLIYSGRPVLSDYVYRTKKIAELQSRLPKKQYTSRKIGLFYRKRTRHFKHAVRAMLKDLFEDEAHGHNKGGSRRPKWNKRR